MMNWIKDSIKSVNGNFSSKRVGGYACILFSMLVVLISLMLSEFKDVSDNVMTISLQFLLTGAGMIGAGLFEKVTPQNKKKGQADTQ